MVELNVLFRERQTAWALASSFGKSALIADWLTRQGDRSDDTGDLIDVINEDQWTIAIG